MAPAPPLLPFHRPNTRAKRPGRGPGARHAAALLQRVFTVPDWTVTASGARILNRWRGCGALDTRAKTRAPFIIQQTKYGATTAANRRAPLPRSSQQRLGSADGAAAICTLPKPPPLQPEPRRQSGHGYRLPLAEASAAVAAFCSISAKSSWNRCPVRALRFRNFSQHLVTHFRGKKERGWQEAERGRGDENDDGRAEGRVAQGGKPCALLPRLA
jgi:hypothetical protein